MTDNNNTSENNPSFEGNKMVKYKCLTSDELQTLEKEFINFLSSMQITGADWEKMKYNEIENAEELIIIFSDMVYEKVLSKIQFLEYRDAKTLNIFNCLEDKIILVGLHVKEHSSLDLTSSEIFDQWTKNNTGSINVIKTEKKYTKERAIEVFDLLQSGSLITDDKLFNLLIGMM